MEELLRHNQSWINVIFGGLGMAKEQLLSFDFSEGKILAGKYLVEHRLGVGYEGEVYKVREIKTGVPRAAKFYYPIRNPNGRTLVRYSQKLNRLSNCRIIMQYAHQDSIVFRKQRVEFLVSEYIEGEVLKDYMERQPGKRLTPYEALHILAALSRGMQSVHKMREYHGDIHTENIMIQRVGLDFWMKLIDFYHWNGPVRENIFTDVVDMIRILYDLIGGQKHYSKMPPQIKSLCCGLKVSLIRKKYRTAGQLIQAIHQLEW